jgi:hypothetical protein
MKREGERIESLKGANVCKVKISPRIYRGKSRFLTRNSKSRKRIH